MSAPTGGNGFWLPEGLFSDPNGLTLQQYLAIASGALAVANSGAYTQINTNTTVTLKTGAGVLVGAWVVTAGTATTVNIYDNTAGSGQLLSPSNLATTAAGALALGFPTGFGVRFVNGLTVVTAGTAAATLNVLWL